jgi:hypothetical protein
VREARRVGSRGRSPRRRPAGHTRRQFFLLEDQRGFVDRETGAISLKTILLPIDGAVPHRDAWRWVAAFERQNAGSKPERQSTRHSPDSRRLKITARAATSDEVKDLRREASALKEVVAELTLENRLLKKSMITDGEYESRHKPQSRFHAWRDRSVRRLCVQGSRPAHSGLLAPGRRCLGRVEREAPELLPNAGIGSP